MVMASGRIDYFGGDLSGGGGGRASLYPEGDLDLHAKGLVNRPVKVNPLDDLTFDVDQDPDTAAITRRLARLKSECIQKEDFPRAKRITAIIASLRTVGEELGKLGR
jgi:hypothetical protein